MPGTSRKYLLLAAVLVLALCLALMVAMAWTPLPTWLANRAVDLFLEDALNLEVHIDDVGGDLFHRFTIEGIELRSRDGELRSRVKMLSAEYHWRDLVGRRWRLEKLDLQDPVLFLLAKSSQGPAALPDTSVFLLPLGSVPDIHIQDCSLIRGQIVDQDGILADSLALVFSLEVKDRHARIELSRCSLSVPRRHLSLRSKAKGLVISPEDIRVELLEARTPMSGLSLSGRLKFAPSPSCSLQVQADSLSLSELAALLEQDSLPPGRLQFSARLQGWGQVWAGRVELAGRAAGWDVQQMDADFSWAQKQLGLEDLRVLIAGAGLQGRGRLDLASGEPRYEADVLFQQVDLSAMSPRWPATSLRGRLVVSGTGRSAQTIQASADISLEAGTAADFAFQSIAGGFRYRQGALSIPQGLEIRVEGARALVSGTLDARWRVDALARVEISDVGRLMHQSGLSGSLQASLHALGPVSDPQLAGLMEITDLVRDGQRLDAVRGSVGLAGAVSRKEGFFTLRFAGAHLGQQVIQTGLVQGRFAGQKIFVDSISAQGPQGELSAAAEIERTESGLDLHIEPLRGRYQGWEFAAAAPLILSYQKGQVSLQPAQFEWLDGTVTVQGTFGPDDRIQGQARLDLGQMEPLARLLLPGHDLSGSLACDLTAGGSVNDPQAAVSLLWQGGRLDQVDVDRVEADLAYHHGQLTVNDLEARRGDTHFHAQGFLPLDLSAGGLVPDQPWDLSLTGEGTEVGFLPLLIKDVERLEGSFSTEFQASGTPSEPQYSGFFKLQNGLFKLTAMGNTIQNLSAQVHLDGQYLVIDGIRGVTPLVERNLFKKIWSWFFPSRRRGSLEAFGRINLARTAFDVTAKGSRFYINYLEEQVEAESDFNLRITGIKRPQLSGQVTVSRALVSRPMVTTPRVASTTGPAPFDVDLTVQLPKNFWVRNEAVEVELRGQMQVLQGLEGFGLLGNLETIRGSYFFYGNDFRIDRGQVTFDDPEDINPLLDVQAWTQVDRERIDLAISGRMRSPTVTLTSASGYGEGDIIALLALHQSSTGLDTVGTGEVVTTQAGSFFGSYLREALNRKAGRLLGVDTFKITPDSDRSLDLSRAELTVGTYLSSQVYVEYSRRLSQESGEQVGVEYSLTRNLSLDGKRDRNGLYRLGLNVRWDY